MHRFRQCTYAEFDENKSVKYVFSTKNVKANSTVTSCHWYSMSLNIPKYALTSRMNFCSKFEVNRLDRYMISIKTLSAWFYNCYGQRICAQNLRKIIKYASYKKKHKISFFISLCALLLSRYGNGISLILRLSRAGLYLIAS